MLESLLTLLGFQLLGEALAHGLALPVPGPVLGMLLLFLAWPALGRLHESLERTSDTLLGHFGLLFVPAGTGVILHVQLLAQWWGPLAGAVLAGGLLSMALCAAVYARAAGARQGPRA